jgi:YD repeat-containing protein
LRSPEYSHAVTGYADPDAVTQITNGYSTTTYAYDNNGNLTSAGTSTFSWDYNSRMTQAATQGSTTTYAYDYAGNRVSQTVGSTTTIYPNKYYYDEWRDHLGDNDGLCTSAPMKSRRRSPSRTPSPRCWSRCNSPPPRRAATRPVLT